MIAAPVTSARQTPKLPRTRGRPCAAAGCLPPTIAAGRAGWAARALLFLWLARLWRGALLAGLTRRACGCGFFGFTGAAIFGWNLRADQFFNRAQLVAIFTRT